MLAKIKSLVIAASALALAAAVPAHAAVPTGVEAVFTTTATDFGTIVGYGWVLFLTIMGGMILFKIVKKVLFRST